MDILGIGPLELLLIFLIALIFLGPNDMVKAGRTLGRTMRKIVTSDTWREITRLRTLPNQLMRDAGLEEELKELQEIQKDLPEKVDLKTTNISADVGAEMNSILPDLSAWTNPAQSPEPASKPEDSQKQQNPEEAEASSEKVDNQAVEKPEHQP